MINDPVERFRLLVQMENIKMPWLEKNSGIERKRWANIKNSGYELKATETQALGKIFPEYALWITTGEELPEAGQISPLSKLAQSSYKTAPKVG